jgi:hypothetical protein
MDLPVLACQMQIIRIVAHQILWQNDQELITMKLEILILILIFAPELAIAQEMAMKEIDPLFMSEQTIASQSQNGHPLQIAYAAPSDKSIIELNAIAARRIFSSDQNLYSDTKQTAPLEASIIEEWRERVYKSLKMHSRPRHVDLVYDSKLRSNNDVDEQAQSNRMVSKIVLRETLRFTQERLPEIDKLVKVLKFEVSTDMIPRQVAETESHDIRTKETPVGHIPAVEKRLFVKTGLRLPIERGRLGLVSETEARYGNVSSFFSICLDGQFDNSMGLIYVLGNDIQFKYERQIAHSMDPITSERMNDKASNNLIQLVCSF